MNSSTIEEKRVLMNVAMGKEPADIVWQGGMLVNVHTMETYPADIAIKNGRIAFVGDVSHTVGSQTRRIDASGKYLMPGLIETHMHAGGSQLNMTEFGKLALMHGSVSIVTDMYEIGIISGKRGVRFCVDELNRTGVRTIFAVPMPAYHQNEAFENLGTFTLEDALEVLEWPDCYGLNEVNLAKLAAHDENVEKLVFRCQELGKSTIGHAAALHGKALQSALDFVELVGDHECTTWEEANEKARLGMTIQLRDGSVGSDITAIVSRTPYALNTIGDFTFSTDEIAPDRMQQRGHMDYKLRMAIEAGAPPLQAIRAGTLHAARMLRLDHDIGSLTPGRFADIIAVDDLRALKIDNVMVAGQMYIENGHYVGDVQQPEYPDFLSDSVHLEPLGPDHFRIPAPAGRERVKVRVIKARDGSLFSEATTAELVPENGFLEADAGQDILKIAQLDRHQRSGRMGIGFITGFQIKNGAIASAYNPCSENLSVMGTNDADMVIAANYVIDKKGAFVAVRDGQVMAALDMPIAGIMSRDSYEQVASQLREVHAAVASMGCVISNPFHIMAFMVFPAHFGELKLCTYGLVDVDNVKVVDLVAD